MKELLTFSENYAMDMKAWKWMAMGMMMGILFGKYVCGA
jgi:hypothetical protein